MNDSLDHVELLIGSLRGIWTCIMLFNGDLPDLDGGTQEKLQIIGNPGFPVRLPISRPF